MIEFQHVSFAYEMNCPVLQDLSFRVEKGEAVGLIGSNGVGKTSIMKLLLGLIEGEGKILVDGIEVRRDTLPEIRRKLGFVLQNSDNQMFMPTVYEDMMFAPLNYMITRRRPKHAWIPFWRSYTWKISNTAIITRSPAGKSVWRPLPRSWQWSRKPS